MKASWGYVVLLIVCLTFLGVTYGIVLNVVDKDNYIKNKNAYIGISITTFVFILILSLIALFIIAKDPNFNMIYLFILSHVSLLLSILSVTANLIN